MSVLLAPGGVFARVVGWVLDIARRRNVTAMNVNSQARGIRIPAQGAIGGIRARIACVADAIVFFFLLRGPEGGDEVRCEGH